MHIGVGAVQLVLATHCTHLPPSLQMGVAVPAHSALDVHCTQLEVVTLQWGAAAGHCPSLVQPLRHLNSSGSQIGAELPQSAFDRHDTHSPERTRQRGAPAGQSALARHCTQSCVELSQIWAVAGRSFGPLHPTQSPVVMLQSAALVGHDALFVHAAWHA
jgi:hypothetical protein